MKFTKEDAVKELEARIPSKDKALDLGRTISEAVDNSMEMIGIDSEMELTVFVEHVLKLVKTSIGLTHSENSKVAGKLQEQIRELQKKQEKNDISNPDLLALQEEVQKLKDAQAKIESEKAVAMKRSELAAKMSESIKDKEWIKSYLAEISVTADFDVEKKSKDYVAFYNKTHTGGGKSTPLGTDSKTEDSDVKKTHDLAKSIMKQRNGMISQSVT